MFSNTAISSAAVIAYGFALVFDAGVLLSELLDQVLDRVVFTKEVVDHRFEYLIASFHLREVDFLGDGLFSPPG